MISKDAIRRFVDRAVDYHDFLKTWSYQRLWDEVYRLAPDIEFKTKPYARQLVTTILGLRYRNFCFILDMGTGKTKAMLDLISYRKKKYPKCRPFLVLVPSILVISTWEKQIKTHSNLTYSLVIGTMEEKRAALEVPADIYVSDYAGVQLILSSKKSVKMKLSDKRINKMKIDPTLVAQYKRRFGGVVFDELHHAGHENTARWKMCREMSEWADTRYGSTGTLFGKHAETTWERFYLVDRGHTLGFNFYFFQTVFCKEYYDHFSYSKKSYKFDTEKLPLLTRTIKHRSIHYSSEECQDLPKRTPIPIELPMMPGIAIRYKQALDGLIAASQGNYVEIGNHYLRMRQLCSSFLTWKDQDGDHVMYLEECPKIDWILEWLEDTPEKVVIFYEYTPFGQRIVDALKEAKVKHMWVYGKTKNKQTAIDQFTQGPAQALVLNSASGGTGVDGLQEACRYGIFAETPSDPVGRAQANKRLHRDGQKWPTFLYDLIIRGSVEETIQESIAAGIDLHKEVMQGRGIAGLTQRKKLPLRTQRSLI